MEFERADIEELIKYEIAEAILRFGAEVKGPIMRIVCLERMIPQQQQPEEVKHQRQIPLSKWNEYYPDPSVSALRKLDFKRSENGFEKYKVTERRGKKVLINEGNYFAWLKAKNNKGVK